MRYPSMNNYYLIEKESTSGLLALANILNHERLGIKIGTKTIIPWLINNQIISILEADDNYSAKNSTEKNNYKQELQKQFEEKFQNNNFESLKLEFTTFKNNEITKTVIYVSKINIID